MLPTIPQLQAELYVQAAAIAGTFRIGLATEMLNYAFSILDENTIAEFFEDYSSSFTDVEFNISNFAQHILYQVADFQLCEYQEVMQEWLEMFPSLRDLG